MNEIIIYESWYKVEYDEALVSTKESHEHLIQQVTKFIQAYCEWHTKYI